MKEKDRLKKEEDDDTPPITFTEVENVAYELPPLRLIKITEENRPKWRI